MNCCEERDAVLKAALFIAEYTTRDGWPYEFSDGFRQEVNEAIAFLHKKNKELMNTYRGVELAHGEGWNHLSKPVIDFVLDNGGSVFQVKEKFAELRIYADMPNDELQQKFYDVLRPMEEASLKTCEICGEPGKIRSGGWVRTLCEEHHLDRG